MATPPLTYWSIKEKKTIITTNPFAVEELHCQPLATPEGHALQPKTYYRLTCLDWINVLPITPDGKAILIKQDRMGALGTILETPGGVVDPTEKHDPTLTAVRELEEETGYTTRRILPLLSINPNPALQNNKVHLFLAKDCILNPERKHFPEADEKITLEFVDVTQLEQLVRWGRIDHALCALTIMLAGKYVPIAPSTL